ncbi:U-scoloptoxin(16)-Ssd1a-like [Coccinella septempunctata]|uniref:U-scoloptoxin(16)-Ssd1a-like n=1 Tax=Coccinella septempunctata TaxID=41139 RepID=UPI001D06E171|nr:U-scoloptoxin(16)-Ssd1a-like [Coccinella septempunctata]
MKVLFLLFFLCLSTYVNAWVARGQTDSEKLKGHPNQCWTEDLGYIESGVTKRLPKQCAELSCGKNGEYTITGCISVNVEPPCTVEKGDLSKPYPDCCFEVKCPKKSKL